MTATLGLWLVAVETKKCKWWWLSGIAWGAAFLAKGQPVILLGLPLAVLVLARKAGWREVVKIGVAGLAVCLPWLTAFWAKYGVARFFSVYFLDFVGSRANVAEANQQAPVYWYSRWWLAAFRPGVYLLGTLAGYELVRRRLTWQKMVLLVYVAGGLVFFSLAANKVWWYVLPFLLASALYIMLAVRDYLKNKKSGLVNLALVVAIGSLPAYWLSGDYEVIKWGAGVFLVGLVILFIGVPARKWLNLMIVPALVLSVYLFWPRFPAVSPTFPEIVAVGEKYQDIGGGKCLWVADMPYEAALFYSQAREINFYTSVAKAGCENYLVTPDEHKNEGLQEVFSRDRLFLYKFN